MMDLINEKSSKLNVYRNLDDYFCFFEKLQDIKRRTIWDFLILSAFSFFNW